MLRDMVMCAGSSVSTAHGGWLAGAGSALVLYPAVLSTSVVQRLQPPPAIAERAKFAKGMSLLGCLLLLSGTREAELLFVVFGLASVLSWVAARQQSSSESDN